MVCQPFLFIGVFDVNITVHGYDFAHKVSLSTYFLHTAAPPSRFVVVSDFGNHCTVFIVLLWALVFSLSLNPLMGIRSLQRPRSTLLGPLTFILLTIGLAARKIWPHTVFHYCSFAVGVSFLWSSWGILSVTI